MENSKKIIESYVNLMKSAVKIWKTDDIKATNTNKIVKRLRKLQDKILVMGNYKEIYEEILNQTNDDIYWQEHYDMAESLYTRDKEFAIQIYERHKRKEMAKDRIRELIEELKKEKKNKWFLWKIFWK